MREKHKKHKDYSRCNSRYVVIKSGFNVLKTVVSKLSAAVPPPLKPLYKRLALLQITSGHPSPYSKTAPIMRRPLPAKPLRPALPTLIPI